MQTNLLWTGIEYYSLENCLINTAGKNNHINSSIIGYYQDKIYNVSYYIKTSSQWETYFLELEYRINNEEHTIKLEKINDDWLFNKEKKETFKHCIDIDISITPFTNTLPINRLQLRKGEQSKINVIYINIFEHHVKPVHQSYQCIAAGKFLYKNIPNDFEAEIEVDEAGFVINYPSLFKRTAIIEKNK